MWNSEEFDSHWIKHVFHNPIQLDQTYSYFSCTVVCCNAAVRTVPKPVLTSRVYVVYRTEHSPTVQAVLISCRKERRFRRQDHSKYDSVCGTFLVNGIFGIKLGASSRVQRTQIPAITSAKQEKNCGSACQLIILPLHGFELLLPNEYNVSKMNVEFRRI